jgi:hypothetical protein
MNTPELTLKELQEMEHDLKQYYGGCFPFGERKLESLLSLARIQIESQGVTRKSGGPSSTLPASSDTGEADVPPFGRDHSENKHRYVWWSWHPAYPQWEQSCWGADSLREAILDLHRPLACKMRLYHNKLVRRDGNEHTVVYDLAPNEDLDHWHFEVDRIFLDARKAANQSPPIHTEESPSDSELLTDGDVERLEDLQKALKAEGYRNSLSHEMGVLIPRILPVLRSVIKAAMKQEK